MMLGMTSCQMRGKENNGVVGVKSPISVVYSSDYRLRLFGLERLHPFDIAKYDKIHKALDKAGCLPAGSSHIPKPLTNDDLLLVHSPAYLESLKDRKKVATYLEAPILARVPKSLFQRSVVQPFIHASGGTLAAARLALKEGMAINLGGGYHHAMPERGEGFCIIADVPIAIRKLQNEGLVKRALVIDTDIHQGNGTVECLKDDPSTYTFSMHEMGIYPHYKPKGDWDIGLRAGVTDARYLEVLAASLDKMFAESKPDIVFHVAGCDALRGDPLANGMMSAAGIAARDRMIVEACKKHGVAYVMTMAGGYSKGAWEAQYLSIRALILDDSLRIKRNEH